MIDDIEIPESSPHPGDVSGKRAVSEASTLASGTLRNVDGGYLLV
jgi:hypothetical protein